MSVNRYQNWIHFDFKGMLPSEEKLVCWLDRMASWRFSHVLFEYEDRLPWGTFHGTWRPGFTLEQWHKIWNHATKVGIKIIPLIQTFGHLEWLLKHDQWAHLRCAGHANLVCPEHPEIRPLLTAWIKEVAALHPDSPYIHVGLDEVYHMGACPACQARAAASPLGNSAVLLNHARFVCEAVLATGKRPIIWADMFIHHKQDGLESLLPEGTVICDWKYSPSFETHTAFLSAGGRNTVMGASAIRKAYPTYRYLVDLPQGRIENIKRWHRLASEHDGGGEFSALIHTVWTRSRGLSPCYGPWEGWLPSFAVAANPEVELSAPIQRGMEILDRGLKSGEHDVIESAAAELSELHSEDSLEESALRWWEISLRHHAEVQVFLYHVLGEQELKTTVEFLGTDPDLMEVAEQVRQLLGKNLDTLEKDIRSYLEREQWSDIDEYVDSRAGALRRASGL